MTKRMYRENVKSINWFVGCNFQCDYCKLSFQRQMKRQGKRCGNCYDYAPHAHLERLLKAPPRTRGDEFIFFPSSGEVSFTSPTEFKAGLAYAEKWSDRTFLIQSKTPSFFLRYSFPDNIILGTTIETNATLFVTPSRYVIYEQISRAPPPYLRKENMVNLRHPRKLVTIEPILDFELTILVSWIREIEPQIVYVGYDNHGTKLPEPYLWKTQMLIDELKKFTEVRVKTLRKAWFEVER